LFTNQTRSFAKRYFLINYEYSEDTYYRRIPLRGEHEKQLKTLQAGDTKVLAAPHFPYDGNTIMVE